MRKASLSKAILKVLCCLSFMALTGCAPDQETVPASTLPLTDTVIEMNDLQVRPDFNYSSGRKLWFSIELTTINGNPAANRAVSILMQGPQEYELIASGQTSERGLYEGELTVAADVKELLFVASVMGKHNRQLVKLDNDLIQVTF